MSLSFAFIGNRPDLGELIPSAHRDVLQVSATPGGALAWGIGFFQTDEVLLRRRPMESAPSVALDREMSGLRCHALLAHVCQTKRGALRAETTPPLRFGHFLFSCEGTSPHLTALRPSVTAALPDFLKSHLKGDTFTELAFTIFLDELPRHQLEKNWQSASTRSSAGPTPAEAIRATLERTLARLDEFAEKAEIEKFVGDLWVNTGEYLIIAHRTGRLGLRVYRDRAELAALVEPGTGEPHALKQTHFAVVLSGPSELPVGFERLPDNTMLTASRTVAPETRALA